MSTVMNKDALYNGRIAHLFFYFLELIGLLVGLLIKPSLVTILLGVLALIVYIIVFRVSQKDKVEGKIFPWFMMGASVIISLCLGYAYYSVVLILLAFMVNNAMLTFFEDKRLFRWFGVISAASMSILGAFQFPFINAALPLRQILIIAASLLISNWMYYIHVNQLDFMKRKTFEQERSLDDLLKLVEEKRVQTRQYSEELEEMKNTLEDRVAAQTEEIRVKTGELIAMQQNAIEGMATLIESRDGNTGEHVRNTRVYVSMIVTYLKEHKMYPEIVDNEFVSDMILSAPLHDIGKIEISDVILNKPGRFTPEEFEIMKTHAALGDDVVTRVLGENSDPKLLKVAQEVAHFHHEKYNGAGYPMGLASTEIPLSARIMAISDVFDALVSKRVYKDSISIEDAYKILNEDAGKHFDPELVEVFNILRPEVEEYIKSKS